MCVPQLIPQSGKAAFSFCNLSREDGVFEISFFHYWLYNNNTNFNFLKNNLQVKLIPFLLHVH